MNEDMEAFKAWLNNAGSRWEMLEANARVISFPDDLGSLLDQYEDAAHELEDSKAIIMGIQVARRYLAQENIHKTKVHILDLKEQIENGKHSEYLEGTSRQLRQAGKQRAEDLTEERKPHWEAWKNEAERIRSESVIKLSQIEVARRIKKNLNLSEALRTITRVLNK